MILLHICCAPCGGGCVEKMLESGEEPRLFFSNSNLEPEEFGRRLESVRRLAEIYRLDLEVDPCDHAAWLAWIAGLESEPEHGARCPRCFEFSFRRASRRAAELGCRFTTTLSVSPRKSTAVLFEVGSRFDNFEAIDFKKGGTYRRSCEISREYGFYRQRFCGCPFSEAEAERFRRARASAAAARVSGLEHHPFHL